MHFPFLTLVSKKRADHSRMPWRFHRTGWPTCRGGTRGLRSYAVSIESFFKGARAATSHGCKQDSVFKNLPPFKNPAHTEKATISEKFGIGLAEKNPVDTVDTVRNPVTPYPFSAWEMGMVSPDFMDLIRRNGHDGH